MDAIPLEPIASEIKQDAILEKITKADCEIALSSIKSKFPNTMFVSAKPSELNGYILLELQDGSFAYTDKSAKFLIIGVIFDTVKGYAIDQSMSGSLTN